MRDPYNNKYSIASGHDYGRRSKFPDLCGITLSAVVPVRNYNIDVLVKANHATGHSICFPSNGPAESSKELPCIDPERMPHVTFLGPKDRWRKEKGQWKHLYNLDCDKAYEALRIWVGLKNPAFEGITIVDSAEKRAQLEQEVSKLVEEAMIVTEDETIAGISNVADEQDLGESGCVNKNCTTKHVDGTCRTDSNDSADGSTCHVVHSAVLPQQSLATIGKNSGIKTYLEVIKAGSSKKSKKRTEKKSKMESENMPA